VTDERVSPSQAAADRLTDGEWHRLHPATPLLKGGIFFVAVLGIVISNLRERLVNLFVGQPDYGGDPIDEIYNHHLVGVAILIVAGVLILCISGFYLSWRMHTFRIGDEAVEVRSGIFRRTNRKARLDRIQGINLVRPLFARLFGAAKLEVIVAGHDANVHLSYLSSGLADGVRRDILVRASGIREVEALRRESAMTRSVAPGFGGPGAVVDDATIPHVPRQSAASALVNRRVNEFLAPELDPDAAPPESVVRIRAPRLLGSLVLSGFTVFLAIVAVLLVAGALTGHFWLLVLFLPTLIGFGSLYVKRFTKALRYSIAGTPDGVRIGFGLFTTSNATLPPGRIHAVEVSQPILWRPFHWWQVRIDTAGRSRERSAEGHHETTILPVGSLADARRVFELALPDLEAEGRPDLIEAGMTSRGGDEFTPAPRRARWIRPFSWRRTGFFLTGGVILLRHGLIRRRLVVVPLARLQSVELYQGPVDRVLRLVTAKFHTVEGPVRPKLVGIDKEVAIALFGDVSREAVASAKRDTSHRWNSGRREGLQS
jgi:putative membrane protein